MAYIMDTLTETSEEKSVDDIYSMIWEKMKEHGKSVHVLKSHAFNIELSDGRQYNIRFEFVKRDDDTLIAAFAIGGLSPDDLNDFDDLMEREY